MEQSFFESIFNKFDILGSFDQARPFGSGHINDTYLVENKVIGCPNYILQRINPNVFRNIASMSDNIAGITSFMRHKLSNEIQNSNNLEVLTLIKSKTGDNFYIDSNIDYWNCYLFINDSLAVDVVTCEKQAYEGGKAFGNFLALLNDYPAHTLYETIPNFHNMDFRLKNFENAVNSGLSERIKENSDLIQFVRDRAESMRIYRKLGQQNKIPLRVTHNDTKINNVLLDKSNNALCVIDLGTVMPGYMHFDFGDSIRTVTNSGAEDEQDLSKVQFNFEYYTAYLDGYLSQTKDFITKTELEYLAFAPQFMTFIMGLRFLTDYLEGDVYYKISRPHHNLERCKSQFKLLQDMEARFDEMNQKVLELSYL